MSTSLRFAHAVRTLSESTRLQGLIVPLFRSPPRSKAAPRTIRWTSRGAVVAVAVRDRAWVEILTDMIDGVVAVNELAGAPAIRARTALWAALDHAEVLAA